MKNSIKNIFLAFAILLFTNTSFAQQVQTPNNPVNAYLELKDALFKGDQQLAAQKAEALSAWFGKNDNTADWKKPASKIKDAASRIAADKDLAAQRKDFASLSAEFIAGWKALPQHSTTAYVQYCPMKKASWLSAEKDIRNPYYGSQMANCGSVTETIEASTK